MTTLMAGPWLAAILTLPVAGASPQDAAPPSPSAVGTAVDRMMIGHYGSVKRALLAAVDKMPADKMAFVPADGSRSFAQAAAHVAVSNLAGCRRAGGESLDVPALRAREAAAKTKEAVRTLMDESFAACDPVFATAGEDRHAQTRAVIIIHSWEVYGVMTVYLRLNGIVPPTTEQQNRARDGAAASSAIHDAEAGRGR